MNVPFRPAYALAGARPLFIDAWPAAWTVRAPTSTLVWLDPAEMQALGAQVMGWGHWFGAVSPAPLRGLCQRLDAVLAAQAGNGFIRLTSRSPKDSLRAMRHGLRVRSGREALALILEGSQRAAHDLRACLDAGVPLAIVVRPWLHIEPGQEWRCVMRSRRFAGASPARGPGAASVDGLLSRLTVAVDKLARCSPVDHAVFDLRVDLAQGGWQLLDANPLSAQTGLGAFGSVAELDGSLRLQR